MTTTTNINRLPTTTITRIACSMCPDPCPTDDYLVSGISSHGDTFSTRVHHRGRRMWLIEDADFRQDWSDFTSLQDVVDHLECCQ